MVEENSPYLPNCVEIRDVIKEALYLSSNDELQGELFKIRNLFEEYNVRIESEKDDNHQNSSAVKWRLNFEKEIFSLWNRVSVNQDEFSPECTATVDFLILNLFVLISKPHEQENGPLSSHLLKYIKISTATCRALIDCKQFERGEKVLRMISQFIEIFPNSQQGSLSKYKFLNEISWVEIYAQRGKDDEAFLHVQKAKNFAWEGIQCQIYLTRLCYNLGLELFRKENFEKSVFWLKISFQTGSDFNHVDAAEFNLSDILNLLAKVYLFWAESDHWEKAVDAIHLSEKHGKADFLIKVKALICGESDHQILLALSQWINFGPSIPDAYQIIECLIKYKRFSITIPIIQDMEINLSRDECGQFLYYFIASLQEDNLCEAEQILKYFSESSIIGFSQVNANALFTFCRRQADSYQISQRIQHALIWYNFSEYFALLTGNVENIAMISRCKSLNHLSEGNLEKLEREIKKIKANEKTTPVDFYLEFRFYLLTHEKEQAIDVLKKLVNCLESEEKNCEQLLCLAIREAFKSDENEFIIDLLEKIIECSKDSFIYIICVKLFVRSKLKTDTIKNELCSQILIYLRSAYEFLRASKERSVDIDNLSSDAQWFSKVSWNLAIQPTSTPHQIFSAFQICFKFLSLFPSNDVANITSRHTTFLLTTAACRALVNCETEAEEKKTIFKQIIDKTTQYELTLQDLTEITEIPQSFMDYLIRNLRLYKFEALARIDNPLASNILDDILSLPRLDLTTLERLSAIIYDLGPQYLHMRIRVLKILISTHKQSEICNITTLTAYHRSLICGLFERFSITEDNDHIWDALHEGVQFILTTDKCPEIEVLWLMIKIWNVGVEYLVEKQQEKAEKWCKLSSELLLKLPTVRKSYEHKINSVLNLFQK